MKWVIPFWVWWEVDGNLDNKRSEFPHGGKVIAEQILASDNPTNKSKQEGQWESQLGIWVGKLTIWVRSFEIKL